MRFLAGLIIGWLIASALIERPAPIYEFCPKKIHGHRGVFRI